MTDEHKQRLSELLDGELEGARAASLLDAVAVDSELRATWERYHLIAQAIRREPIEVRYRTCAEQIRQRIASEPAVLAPRGRRRPTRRSLQRAAGLAMAASVAVVAFFAAPMLLQDTSSGPDASTPVAQLVERESISIQRLQREHPELASKLGLYLVTHQVSAPATGAKGMLPYATLVSYEATR